MLAFAFMHFPLLDSQDEGSISFPTLQSLVDEYLAHRFYYFDTGWMYCKEKSNPRERKYWQTAIHAAPFLLPLSFRHACNILNLTGIKIS